MLPRFSCVILLGLAPATAIAQSHPLVGTWALTKVSAATRFSEGKAEPIFSTGTLVVQSVGDSLIATLSVVAPAGMSQSAPTRYAARTVPGVMVFQVAREVTGTLNGAPLPVSTKTLRIMTLSVSGDSLGGTTETKILDDPDLPTPTPAPIVGTRTKP